MKRLLVLGFYGKENMGDEMFQETLPLLVPDFNCDFISTDDFKGSTDSYYAIICGAGDIFNEYFMSKIEQILINVNNNKPVYILGMGIPYLSMFQMHYLSLFDHVFLRETTDLPQLTREIGGRYAHSLPDLAFLKKPLIWHPNKEKKIAVFLAQPMRIEENYMDSLIELLVHISKFGDLKFIRFNYSENPKEDDKFIQNDVQQILLTKGISVDNDLFVYTTDQVLKILTGFHFAICARFHSHIYATISGCPFISIATTRKVQLYLKEENLDSALNTGKDAIFRFNQIWEQKLSFSNQLQSIAKRNHKCLQTKQVNNLLLRKSRRPKDVEEFDKNLIYESAKNYLFKLTKFDITLPNAKTEKHYISKLAASKVAANICFEITKMPGSVYEWGTVNNIMTKPWELKEMIEWIIKDFNKKKSQKLPKLDLDFYDQNDLNGLHRAGWQYVLTYLRILNNNRGILCDTFVDRSFLWGRWSLAEAGIIPYTGLWIGFIHHTPNKEYTSNNCWEIIKSNEFLQSVPTCRGIICFSEYLSKWFRDRFKELQINLPVVTLFHPTIFVNIKWSPSKINWSEINLINVGAWYRNPFSIYQINVPSHIKKMALKGSKMDSYFPPTSLTLNKYQILNPDYNSNLWVYYFCLYIQQIIDWSLISSDFILNLPLTSNGNHLTELNQLYQIIQEKIYSVNTIEKLENNQYDELLSNSVVFLNLVDASAVNTVIECIVRETPILINRLPALEEYLGKEYPLFYDNLDQVFDLLQPKQILSAHDYLKSRDKEFLKIDSFLSEIIQTDIYHNLL